MLSSRIVLAKARSRLQSLVGRTAAVVRNSKITRRSIFLHAAAVLPPLGIRTWLDADGYLVGSHLASSLCREGHVLD